MKKALLAVLLAVLACTAAYAGQARNIELVDVPTANTLLQGEIRIDFKFAPGGGILTRLYVGLFDRVFLGGSFNVNNVIGSGDIVPDFPPNFAVKIRATDDDGPVPAISIGYDGQGYMNIPAKGVFLAVTKELSISSIIMQLSAIINTNDFVHVAQGIDFGAGAAFAFTREFTACAEIDGLFGGDNRARVSFGLGYFFNPIEIDLGFRFGWGDGEPPQSRVLKITYVTYFN